jgi:glycosyltransferase involved in cell wall biosynthesis
MKILFIHQNYPGQYRALAPALKAAGHEVMSISTRKETELGGAKNITYEIKRNNAKNLQPWLVTTESAVIRGEMVHNVISNLSAQGWSPDVVIGHCGWGEMMFVRQALPKARILGFCEYYYLGEGSDVNFDPEFPSAADAAVRCQARNMHLTQSLLTCDWGVSPTNWQTSLFPAELQKKIKVIFDGIETDRLTPDDSVWIELGRDKVRINKGDEIVTFINRNLEPMRGYHQFMRALPEIMARCPNARIVIVGGDKVSYGSPPPGAAGYKNIFLDEVRDKLDMSRIHFVSYVPYATLINLLRISAAHVYFTYPFVLSWSMLEAMSLEALVIGSNTPPVREVIEHGKNGLLVDFFSPKELANTVCDVLERPDDYVPLRKAARQTVVERYDFRTVCLPAHVRLLTRDD